MAVRLGHDQGLLARIADVTDGAYDEGIADVRSLPAATPTAERMQAVLAQVHKAIAPLRVSPDRW